MKDWAKYLTADEFAEDSVFREWVSSGTYRLDGHPFTDFLADYPHLIPHANEAADLIRATAFPGEELTSDQLKAQIDKTWYKIRLKEGERATAVNPLRGVWFRWAAAAAVIIIGGLIWQERKETEIQKTFTETFSSPSDSWQTFANQGTDVLPLSLSDGSVVWLEPGSMLRFPKIFSVEKREVILTGEAFFEVYKNARQPFFVKSRDVITRVVGTSFFVKTLDNNKGTVVQVRTGQVAVYRVESGPTKEKPVTLQANQQLLISKDSERLLAEPVKQPSVLSGRLDEQHFEFTNVPVSAVFDALSVAYGLTVEYDKAGFENCRITTALSDEPLTEKLHILAETIGAGTRAELADGKIRVTGSGCP